MIKMTDDGMYGLIKVSSDIFRQLNPSYFISHSSSEVKFMCANEQERNHLTELGVACLECVDWYKIILQRDDK